MRKRFAAWLRAPLQQEVDELQQAIVGLLKDQNAQRLQISRLTGICEGLAADLGEHTTQPATGPLSQGPTRVRVAPRFQDFARAAQQNLAQKGIHGLHSR